VDGHAAARINDELVVARPIAPAEIGDLRQRLRTHVELTGSPVATALLADPKALSAFLFIQPRRAAQREPGPNSEMSSSG